MHVRPLFTKPRTKTPPLPRARTCAKLGFAINLKKPMTMRPLRPLLAVLLMLWTGTALAQAYPSRPVRLINPLGTGGTAEVLARTIAKQLSEQIGQPVIVETRTGATGTLGADFVAKSPADGYTLLYGVTGTNSIAPSLYRKLPYDPEKDLAPISILFSGPNVLLAHASLNANTVQELQAEVVRYREAVQKSGMKID
ncbi:MAG: hypothetical protein EXR27_03670 [Betaproteobacteria bacterium]|nr:hypothetical protein [Betaproteobacteria bacterium]